MSSRQQEELWTPRSKDLTQTAPTPHAGMRAFLEYVHEWIGESGYYYDPVYSCGPRCWLTNHAAQVLPRRRRALIFRPVEGRELGPA
jgi:hypothetical protein